MISKSYLNFMFLMFVSYDIVSFVKVMTNPMKYSEFEIEMKTRSVIISSVVGMIIIAVEIVKHANL